MTIAQECYKLYEIDSGGDTTQNSSCTATYYPSQKVSKLDKPDIWDTAGEVMMNS